MSANIVETAVEEGIATVRVDDGRANALSHEVLDALSLALDQASKEAQGVVMTGREGRFCAGFDLSVMTAGPQKCRALVEKGAHLFLKMIEFDHPIVIACNGHALAAGAVWLNCVDWRIGADRSAKIGLNEVAIGMPLPIFATELARQRLSKRHFLTATAHARLYAPAEAVDAGYLDEVVSETDLLSVATARAAELAGLKRPAYEITKRLAWQQTLRHVRDTLEEDMDKIG